MIRINQIKLPVKHTEEQIKKQILKKLKVDSIINYEIVKQSIDARKKDQLLIIYSVDVEVANEDKIIKKVNDNNIMLTSMKTYVFPYKNTSSTKSSPIIVGFGPAGLFAALFLARGGYNPIVIERGEDVDTRTAHIDEFWENGLLNPESNVQFGEGGAGTFSDGKLNTLVNDKFGRNRAVLATFVEYGAPKEILYESKPHIGTDLLRDVVKNMRKEIIRLGGTVKFSTKLTKLHYNQENILTSITVRQNEIDEELPCEQLILAIGHSARDTFYQLHDEKVQMTPKSFAVGLRIEHPREMINISQYGASEDARLLPAASYKLTHQTKEGRNVYSFCMCPGGYVVDASSEPNQLAVNGMSNHDRNADNSNSAIIVNVEPSDFLSSGPLAGIEFQRELEKAAFLVGNGAIPIQLFDDFVNNRISQSLGDIKPSIKGKYSLSNLNDCLPVYITRAIIDGVFAFEKKITGFSRNDALLSGIETRTSSPVRIERDEFFQSNIRGVYPCGEGAGYAGGITSAAMDGIKVAEAVANIE